MGRPYQLSSTPNYETAKDGALSLLTDGSTGLSYFFWRNGTALGWSWRTPVTVAIDLEKPVAVSRVRVTAGAKRSGEGYYPSQILAYGRDAEGRYGFLGASSLQQDDESPAAGTLRHFDIEFPPQVVKEIVTVVFARGAFIWLSEIEAFATGDTAVATLAERPPVTDDLLTDAARRRREAIASLPGPKPTGPSLAQRWAMPLSNTPARSVEQAGQDVAQPCRITRIDPWADGPVSAAAIDAVAPLIALTGGQDYAAFRIENHADRPATISFKGLENDRYRLRWHALAHVQAFNYAWVPDVVVPFAGGSLAPHSSMTLLAEIEPRAIGRSSVTADVQCDARPVRFDLPLQAIAANDNVPPLFGTLWSYVHETSHQVVGRALACDPDVLDRFGEDAPVVHPDALLEEGGQLPADLLARYLHAYRGARRVLLGMDVKTRPWAFKSMPDDEAAKALRRWWDWVEAIAREQGVTGELILYPIDEPQPEDVELLLRTRRLMRQVGVTAKFYSTVEHKTASQLGELDIMQLHRPWKFGRRLPAVKEVTAYDTRHDGKLLPLNAYYRMQGWHAFALGLQGIGVWSMWDGSGLADPASGWDPFVGTRERDFGLLYSAPDGCGWPSRRLLAWRRGKEENRILRTCAGRNAAEAMAANIRAIVDKGQGERLTPMLEVTAEACTR